MTGASGFVGGHLRRAMLGSGALVFGLGTEPVAPARDLEGWVQADLTAAAAVTDAIRRVNPDFVVHLAGQASAGLSFETPERTFRVNVIGTWHILDAAREHAPDARLLIVGSGECYGPQPPGTRVPESAAFTPVSPYAFSKAAADEIAEAACRAWGLDVVRTRSFSHAGPGQSRRFALPSFAAQIARLERTGREGVLRVGNLDVIRDLIDVRDVADCYVALLRHGTRGEAYNVCGGTEVPLAWVVESLTRMARTVVQVEVDPARFRPADVPYLVGDPSRVRAETGWAPKRTLETMLDDLLEEHRRSCA